MYERTRTRKKSKYLSPPLHHEHYNATKRLFDNYDVVIIEETDLLQFYNKTKQHHCISIRACANKIETTTVLIRSNSSNNNKHIKPIL